MKNIDTWNKNVSNYINEPNQKLLENEEAVQLYNGFYVWDSKILQNPKNMIGYSWYGRLMQNKYSLLIAK